MPNTTYCTALPNLPYSDLLHRMKPFPSIDDALSSARSTVLVNMSIYRVTEKLLVRIFRLLPVSKLECGDGIQQESLSSDSECDGLKGFG